MLLVFHSRDYHSSPGRLRGVNQRIEASDDVFFQREWRRQPCFQFPGNLLQILVQETGRDAADLQNAGRPPQIFAQRPGLAGFNRRGEEVLVEDGIFDARSSPRLL